MEIRKLHGHLSGLIREGRPLVASRENIAFHGRIYSIARNTEAELILEGRTRVVRTVADSLGGYHPEIVEDVSENMRRSSGHLSIATLRRLGKPYSITSPQHETVCFHSFLTSCNLQVSVATSPDEIHARRSQ